MNALACAFNPVGCASDWLHGLPLLYVFGAGAVLGLIVGAALGRWAVAALLAVVAGAFVLGKVTDHPAEHGDGPDFTPSPQKPKRPVKPVKHGYNRTTGKWE